MARIRTIKPEFFTSDTITGLTFRQRIGFAGLWTHCDDYGRCRDNAKLIKAAVWPLDDVSFDDVEEDLAAWEAAALIVRYEVDGKRYLAVTGWDEHQAAAYRRGEAKFPPPPDEPRETPDGARANARAGDARDEQERRSGRSTPADGLQADQPREPPAQPADVQDRADCTTEDAADTQIRAGTGNREQGTGTRDTDLFASFWALYPRKIARKRASIAWRNLTKADQQAALDALPKHIAAWKRERRPPDKIPHPTTWLHDARWNDEINGTPIGDTRHFDEVLGVYVDGHTKGRQ